MQRDVTALKHTLLYYVHLKKVLQKHIKSENKISFIFKQSIDIS